MRYLSLFLMFFSLQCLAQEALSCEAEVIKEIEHQIAVSSAKIVSKVSGASCYEAILTIEISTPDNLLYHYQERFKPHIAVHWEDVVEQDAQGLIEREVEDYNFIDCSELPGIEQTGDLPFYSDLLIPKDLYVKFQSSNCKAYIHTYRHYEGNRVVVFPANSQKAVVVR